jgi:transposase-like protein
VINGSPIDAVNVKMRDGNVANRPIYIALAVKWGTGDTLGFVGRRA